MNNNDVRIVHPNTQSKYLRNHHHNDIINTQKALFHPQICLFLILITLLITSILKSNEANNLSKMSISLNRTLTAEKNAKITSEHKYSSKLKEIKATEHRIQLKQQSINQLKNNLTNINTINTGKDKETMDLKHRLNELAKLYEKAKQKEKEYKIQLQDIYVVLAAKELKYNKLLEDLTQIQNKMKITNVK